MPAGIRVGSCLYSGIAAGLVFVLPAFFGLNAICPRAAFAASRITLLTLTGGSANDNEGVSVSSAGDFNGDGYPDGIDGADHQPSGSGAGRAHIFFGGPGQGGLGLNEAGWGSPGDLFGHAVACAGDVNGDGFDDVIVGAPQNSGGRGRAYVFFGGPHADNVPDLILTGAAAGDFFGDAVGAAGDVNGDGYADVIVGARLNDAGGTNAGRAYVFYGGSGADSLADLTLTGAAAGDQFGMSVGSAGDFNGDGKSDVLVGAPLNDAGGTDAGRAYVFYGGPGADATPDLTLTGLAAGDQYGRSTSKAGDVNGDGYGDVVVGAYAHDIGPVQNVGQAYVFYGGPSPDATADLTLTGTDVFDSFGISVAGAGDVDGDGYADIIVGSLVAEVTGSNIGRASIFYGGASPDNVADFVIEGFGAFDNFGVCVATADDVNGDGGADVNIGAPNNDAGGTDAGRAYVFGLDRSPVSAATRFTPTGTVASLGMGNSVAGAGTSTATGIRTRSSGCEALRSRVMYYGGPTADATADLTLRAPHREEKVSGFR
jgi:hypothetical protein